MKLEPSTHNSKIQTEIIDEQKIREITRKFVFDEHIGLEEKEMIFEIIKLIKCDISCAKSIVQQMKDFGMEVCYHWNIGYAIRRFADMRDYVTKDEFREIDKKIEEKVRKEDAWEAKFIEKHGVDKSKWSDDVWDEYEYGEE